MGRVQDLAEQIMTITGQIDDLAKEVKLESTRLNSELSKADKELVDLYHYIEFSNFSAADGYKAYKDLRTCLQRRRAIKEEIDLAQAVTNNYIKVDTLKQQVSTAETLSNTRIYEPRVRTDLFPTTESRTNFTGQISARGKSIANKKGKSFVFANLDEALAMILTTKQEGFKYDPSKIKAKIIKAARIGGSYDGWIWEIS